jgi:hypothetical protein
MKQISQKSSLLFLPLLVFIFTIGCTCQQQKSEKSAEDEIVRSVTIDDQLMEDFNKSKLIFYSLPSPLETAMLIKRSGANYNPEILNDLANSSRYNTNMKMALNLGVYSADMSYSSLFDQTQNTINYMGGARQLAERLGVMEAIDEETIRRLEQNMNNREVVMDIISETFMNSNAYLTEQDRPAIAVMVLVGGWMEGLYIATQLTGGSLETNPKLVDRIVYQKLALQTVINLMESHKSNADISFLMERLNELKVIFDEIKIVTTSDVEAETDPDKKMTILRSEAETFITQDTFDRLVKKVSEIRAEFVS